MQWEELLGHRQQRRWFQTALTRERMASSFLFVGPDGVGKRTFARLLAKSLLCRETAAEELIFCGRCEDCVQIEAGTHPDLIQVSKPPERAYIPVELFIGPREKRMREGLCYEVSLRPFSGRGKIAIIDDADSLNVEGANCLLKTLEEPPPGSKLILVGTSLPRQLPTIRSRCQSILFGPLEVEQVAELLLRTEMVDSHAAADELASQSNGNLLDARQLLDPELRDFRQSLLEMLSMSKLPIRDLAKQCSSIVDAAGKEARLKRDRMKIILRFAAEFYRALAIRLSAASAGGLSPDEATRLHISEELVESFVPRWRRGTREAIQCWEGCLRAMEYVEKNANQTSLLEAWAAEMARVSAC